MSKLLTPIKFQDSDDIGSKTLGQPLIAHAKMTARDVNVFYGGEQAIYDVNLDIGQQEVLSMIGPSGCGKSTFLRCLNRMNDTIVNCRVSGDIALDNQQVMQMEPELLRARVGMVFQKPNPFPKSIYDNIAFGPKIHGLISNRTELDHCVEQCLMRAGLWDEVKDRLDQPALGLSGGQQQRLCIARAISIQPEVILMDEPCSALDPIATDKIEQLIKDLKQNFSIIIVTHSLQQASRISDRAAYFHLGKLVEVDKAEVFFSQPQHPLTTQYLAGHFG